MIVAMCRYLLLFLQLGMLMKYETDAFTPPIRSSSTNNNQHRKLLQQKLQQHNVFGGSHHKQPHQVHAVAAAAAVVSSFIENDGTTTTTTTTTSTSSTNFDNKQESIRQIKSQILNLAERTNRGFNTNRNDREQCVRLIQEISKLNPTSEPARSYYTTTSTISTSVESSLQGKWTLVYTDAPDITSLEQTPFAKLGRIGQECSPPYIKNVIEYTKPSWASNLPLSGTETSTRILQKVVTVASANPNKPTKVQLQISGLAIETDNDNNSNDNNTTFETIPSTSQQQQLQQGLSGISNIITRVTANIPTIGLLPALLQANPINLNGPLTAPFGEFEILYLDNDFRIIQTGQGYYAINVRQRNESEWF